MEGILVVVLVIGVFFCHLIARVAERKGRSYLGFFVLSGLCLPIGLAAALIASPTQEVVVEKLNLVKCEFCAEFIKSEAVICKHCGKNQSLMVNKEADTSKLESEIETKVKLAEHKLVIDKLDISFKFLMFIPVIVIVLFIIVQA